QVPRLLSLRVHDETFVLLILLQPAAYQPVLWPVPEDFVQFGREVVYQGEFRVQARPRRQLLLRRPQLHSWSFIKVWRMAHQTSDGRRYNRSDKTCGYGSGFCTGNTLQQSSILFSPSILCSWRARGPA